MDVLRGEEEKGREEKDVNMDQMGYCMIVRMCGVV